MPHVLQQHIVEDTASIDIRDQDKLHSVRHVADSCPFAVLRGTAHLQDGAWIGVDQGSIGRRFRPQSRFRGNMGDAGSRVIGTAVGRERADRDERSRSWTGTGQETDTYQKETCQGFKCSGYQVHQVGVELGHFAKSVCGD